MDDEETRAAAFRAQAGRRAAYRRQLERTRAGSATARAALEARWAPVRAAQLERGTSDTTEECPPS